VSLPAAIALLALAVAVGGLFALGHDRARFAIAPLRTFAVVAAASIAVLHLLPEAIAGAGWITALATLAGLAGPALLERLFLPHETHRHSAPTTALAMGYAAVIAHQTVEGATVATLAEAGELSTPIVLTIGAHTVPLAMIVGIRVMKLKGVGTGGRRATGLALAGVAGATVAGALAGSLVGTAELEAIEPWLLASVAGLLLHALAHDAFAEPVGGLAERTGDAAAGLLGVALAVSGVEEGGWVASVPWPLRAVGIALLGAVILARSFWGMKRGAGHEHAP
jgi:ZIP family zinc transporter